jgi:hypothetical protein
MAEHPGIGRTAQAEYYEAVHQELAPLARQLERDARKWRMKLHQLRLDVLAVMPENWREDPDWVALAENQKLPQKVGAGGTARKTPNDRVEGRDAASSRRVPSHDGLGGGLREGE